jgi:hypothetical protein
MGHNGAVRFLLSIGRRGYSDTTGQVRLKTMHGESMNGCPPEYNLRDMYWSSGALKRNCDQFSGYNVCVLFSGYNVCVLFSGYNVCVLFSGYNVCVLFSCRLYSSSDADNSIHYTEKKCKRVQVEKLVEKESIYACFLHLHWDFLRIKPGFVRNQASTYDKVW